MLYQDNSGNELVQQLNLDRISSIRLYTRNVAMGRLRWQDIGKLEFNCQGLKIIKIRMMKSQLKHCQIFGPLSSSILQLIFV